MSRRRSALLWGLVGAFVFLVAAQGAVLFDVPLPVGLAGLLAVALGVGAVVAASSYALEHRLTRKGQA